MPAAPVAAFAAWVSATAASAVAALTFASGVVAGLQAWATVISIASTVASTVLKPKLMSSTAGGGSPIDFQGNPSAGVPLVIGRTGYAGSIIHVTSNPANKNSHIAYLMALSAGPIENIESWWVNNEMMRGGGLPAENGVVAPGKYAKNDGMLMNYQQGLVPHASYLPNGLGYTGKVGTPDWTPEHKLSGLAATWWRLRYDKDVYNQGVPRPVWWVINGPAVYDPRLDDTWPGGSGPCRWDNPATWTFDHNRVWNPYLQALSWLAGRRQQGHIVHGVGLARGQVDVAAYVRGANVCDANGWLACGGTVSSTDDKWEVLKAMLQAGGGIPTRLGGMVSCVVQAPRVSIATITREDIAGDCSVAGTKPRRQRLNTVTPRYRSEADMWQTVPGQVVQIPAYVAEDRGERAREMEFPLLQSKDVAAQLAAYAIMDSREFEPVTIPLKPYLQGLTPGDCVTVNEPELGLINQKMVVWGREPDVATGVTTFTFRSETDGKHPFALGKTDVLPGTPGLTGWDGEIEPPEPGMFVVTGGALESEANSVPVLFVEGVRDNPYAEALQIQFRREGGDWLDAGSVVLGDAPIKAVVASVTALTRYEVRVAYLSVLGTSSAWRSLGLTDTGAFLAAGIDAAVGDKVLTVGEKSWVVPLITTMQGARTGLRQRAADYGLTEFNSPSLAAYEQSQASLDAYLATLTTPVGWNDFSGPTDVPFPENFRAAIGDAMLWERNLQTALHGAAFGVIGDLLDDFERAGSDGVLSPNEKNIVIPALRAAITVRDTLRQQADAAGLTTANSTARFNYERWGVQETDAVLATLNSPKWWHDASGETVVPDPFRFRDMFHYISWTTTSLQTAIDASLRSAVFQLASDGVLQPSDKLTLVPIIKDILAKRTEMRRKADGVSLFEWNNLQRRDYERANARLDQQLATLTSPVAWDNRSSNTNIPDPGGFSTAVNECIAFEAGLEDQWFQLYNADIASIRTMAQTAAGAVTDGVLARDEKNQFVPTINYLRGVRARLYNEGAAVGMGGLTPGGPMYEYRAANQYLDDVLSFLTSPVAWNNTSDKTNIPDPAALRLALENAMKWTVDVQTAIAERQRLRMSPWAYFTSMDPGTVVGRTQWLDSAGKSFDHRAFPMNMPFGDAASKNVWPMTSDTGAIYVSGFVEYRTNQVLYMPSGAMGGLSADTEFDVFFFWAQNGYIAVHPNNSPAYKAEPYNYLYIGKQRTAAAPQVWNPPPPPPDGGYGGGGSDTYYKYGDRQTYIP